MKKCSKKYLEYQRILQGARNGYPLFADRTRDSVLKGLATNGVSELSSLPPCDTPNCTLHSTPNNSPVKLIPQEFPRFPPNAGKT
ncbi:hypothetical protein TNCV_1831761 [Trichonephila clavipes]|nr:hypothetical protein TNCV_1831761 [Trichonephila clavipes]